MLSKHSVLPAPARTGIARTSRAGVRLLLLAGMTFALVATVFTSPAQALSGDRLMGHRCRTYDGAATVEDTVAALVDTAGVPGAWCEIDVKRLSDGTLIVWHDPTWARVADPRTLPDGVRPNDRVEDATWSQAVQIRTKGGARVATFARMLHVSAALGVPLLAEVQNDTIRRPGFWVDQARQAGATVTYYQPVTSACTTAQVDVLKAAGAVVGIKTTRRASCTLTASEMRARGVSLVVQDAKAVTRSYVEEMASRGVRVFARGATRSTAPALLQMGVDRLMVDRPREALGW